MLRWVWEDGTRDVLVLDVGVRRTREENFRGGAEGVVFIKRGLHVVSFAVRGCEDGRSVEDNAGDVV